MPGFIKKNVTLKMLERVLIIVQVLKTPGLKICQAYTRFLKKCCTIDAWQYSEYSSGSEYGRVTQKGLLPSFPLDLLQTQELAPKTFWLLSLTLFPH